jgi:hypothetical protein
MVLINLREASPKAIYMRQRRGSDPEALRRSREWKSANPGKVAAHRSKTAEKHRLLKQRSPAYRRHLFENQIRSKFDLTFDAFGALLIAQSGLCDICSNPLTEYNEPCVDHHHESGAVRSLLCNRCNPMVGYAKERADILRAAAEYLERWSNL